MTGHYITNCTLGKPSHVSMDSPRNTRKGQHLDTMSSIINSVTYNLSKHLTSILTPLVCNTQHHNKDSQDFTNKVREITLNPDETIVSCDVTSPFKCILTKEAINVVKKHLPRDHHGPKLGVIRNVSVLRTKHPGLNRVM